MSHAGLNKTSDINFDELEIELQKAVKADQKYNLENNAKLRAMNQGIGSYEEFREIVKAAHLKPITKSDKNKIKPKLWNISAAPSSNSCERSSKLDVKMDETTLPTNCHEFEKLWRRFSSKSDQERFGFLKSLGSSIANIFKSEIVFGLLGEIILCLRTFNSDCVLDYVVVVEILQSMSQAKRFNLTLQFLSNEDKTECQKLFEKLWKSMSDKLQDLADSGISEITINNLMACYNINLNRNN